jgi:hypothetical protein
MLKDLDTIARAALAAAKGNTVRAATRMVRAVKGRPELLEQLAIFYLSRMDEVGPDAGAASLPDNIVRGGAKRVLVHEHRRRTPNERTAALVAGGHAAEAMMSSFDRQIDGRRIGDLRWGELKRLEQNLAIAAASYLRLGNDSTEDFILLGKIEAHCAVSDHGTLVRDAISAAQLQQFIDEAHAEAPHWVSAGMQSYIASLEEKRKSITNG